MRHTRGAAFAVLSSLAILLSCTSAWFRTYVQTGVVLEVNANPTLNVTMQVGQLEETVNVEGSAPLVETRHPGIGQVITNEQVVELPLNGRQLTQLIVTAGMATANGAPGNALASPRSYLTIVITVAGGLANGMTTCLTAATTMTLTTT